MAIFPFIETDSIIQVNDKFRIDSKKTFISKDEADITLVEVEPEAGSGFIDITGTSYKDWYFDWEYASNGEKVISVRVTTDGVPTTKTLTVLVLSEAEDNLFSTDQELKSHESDILKYVPEGKNTFKYMHREAQKQMLEDLYRMGITDINNIKLTKEAIIDIEEVKEWSRFLTLQLIFADLQTTPNDYHQTKSEDFKKWALESRHKSILKLDFNGDGIISDGEYTDIQHRRLSRV